MQIGRNLFDALTHIQHDQKSQKLWVDAICINQSDNAEKSKQVMRMRDIYASAVKTLMWIGNESALPSLVLKDIQDAIQTKLWIPKMEWPIPRPLGDLLPILGPRRMMFDETILDSLGTIWDQEYFSRSWITQEIAVSAQLILICGPLQFDFNEIIELLKVICHFSIIELRNQREVADIIEIREAVREPVDGAQRSSLSEEGSKSDISVDDEDCPTILQLLELLSCRRYQSATDPRDKVYAFLGVSRDSGTFNIEPNYSISVNELYTNVAIKFIEQGDPDILSESQPSYSTLGLPSWVPDWSQPWRGGIARRDIFECGTALETDVRTNILSGSINISGILFDFVKNTDGTPFDSWGPEPWMVVNMQALFEEKMKSLGYEGSYHHTNEPYATVLQQVLTAGRARRVFLDSLSRMNWSSMRTSFDINPFHPEKKKWDSLYKNLAWKKDQWDIFETENGYIGLGPKSMVPGDIVCIVGGATVPYILRPAGGSNYQLIGDSYVHGIMMGEAMEDKPLPSIETFCII